ncbi:M48 metallopeptidase family protein [Vampirovibrio chlorellavorus]|uniref:M48 metallopeptidase family protein n=1 Tax=Vampirovibrio chlorellavorus TaxID=758823 RepID=UPI0026F29631|nr:M48 family metallopeptidase [Vampirovibrio chlorellavorus]
MQVLIEESKKLRRASACIRDGGTIHVKLPRHWPRHLKHSVTQELVERLQKKDAKERALLDKATQQETVTLADNEALTAFVQAINAETFQVPLGKVQIGTAKYNHLAQVNLKTKTMTVSRYCLNQAPKEALRYLIVHELAHYFESGHGPRFWALVAKHMPDYRTQSRIMKAFHHQAVIQEDASGTMPEAPAGKASYASSPKRPALTPTRPPTPQPAPVKAPQKNKTPKDKTGLLPGFVKQLLLWGEGFKG